MTNMLHVIYVLCTTIHHVTGETGLSTVCPYTKFCTEGPLLTTDPERSCCQPCSCSDLCGLVGACCPDKNQTNKKYDVYPCLHQESIYSKYLNITDRIRLVSYTFRVVTGCHLHNHELANQSTDMQEHISRCAKAQSLEDLIWVTSTTSRITYLNKHCAICNGESELNYWSTHITDQQIFESVSSFEERDKLLLKGGHIITFPKKEEDLRLTICYEGVKHECNFTGLWDVYDQELEQKCRDTDFLYYIRNGNMVRTYRNPFCYFCNRPMHVKKHDCKDLIMKKTFSYDTFFSKTAAVNFLALLVIPKTTSLTTVPPETLCRKEEIVDAFQEQCIQLICPSGFVSLHGKCEKLFDKITFHVTEIQFNLSLSYGVESTDRKLQSLLNELVNHVKEVVNAKQANCKICHANIDTISGNDLIFKIAFSSTPYCSYLHYLKRFNEMFNTPFQVFSNTYNVSIGLFGIEQIDRTSETDFTETLAALDIFVSCFAKFTYSNSMIHCPSLLMLKSDLTTLKNSKRIQDTHFLNYTNIGNNTIRICLSDYKRLYALVSKATIPMTADYRYMLSHLCICLYAMYYTRL